MSYVLIYLIVGEIYCSWNLRDRRVVLVGLETVRVASIGTVVIVAALTLVLFWPFYIVNGVKWKS